VFTFTVTAVKNDSVEVSEMLSLLCIYQNYSAVVLTTKTAAVGLCNKPIHGSPM